MNDGWWFVIVALGVGLVQAARKHRQIGRHRARARRRLRDEAPRNAAGSIVEVTGTVRAPAARSALVEAPLSGRRVVFHHSQARVSSLGIAVAEAKLVPFELETADGLVRVEGPTAEAEIVPLPMIPRQLDRQRRFLAAHEIGLEHLVVAGFDEIAIEPGARITVRGLASVETDLASVGERGYRDAPPMRVKLGPPLTIFPAR